MDRDLALDGNEHDDLEEVAGTVRAEDEPPIRILAGVLDGERVVDGVTDSSSAIPWRRAESWTSTHAYRTTKIALGPLSSIANSGPRRMRGSYPAESPPPIDRPT